MRLSLTSLAALLIPICVAYSYDGKVYGTEDPTRKQIADAVEVKNNWMARKGDNTTIVIDTYWHVITNGTQGILDEARIDLQIDALNQAVSPDFKFELVDWELTDNPSWIDISIDTDADRAMKETLRVGDCSDFNIYTTTILGYLSYNSYHGNCSIDTVDDGVVIDYRYLIGNNE